MGAGFLFYDPRDAAPPRQRHLDTRRILAWVVRGLARVVIVVAMLPLAGEVATGVMRVVLLGGAR